MAPTSHSPKRADLPSVETSTPCANERNGLIFWAGATKKRFDTSVVSNLDLQCSVCPGSFLNYFFMAETEVSFGVRHKPGFNSKTSQ